MSLYESWELEVKRSEAKGEARGEARGIKKNKIEVIIKGRENGLDLDMLANITSLSIEEVQTILKSHNIS